MKELIVYEHYQNNLCSIKSIEDTYSDRNYIESIIDNLFDITGGLFYLEVSRPNYDTTGIIEDLKQIMIKNNSFRYTNFDISFYSEAINRKLLEILPQIWFAYEHSCFCFFSEDKIESDIQRKPWFEITSNSTSYVLYKGIEEDVIWIGKSNELEFSVLGHF